MGSSLHVSPRLPVVTALLLSLFSPQILCQTRAEAISQRAQLHQTSDWLLVEPHLPDPATATPSALEMAGDVLRARRFPDDALDFYRSALDRGGDVPRLANRMGITELELRHPELARAYFQRAAKLQPKNGEVWNNMGAADFLAGDVRSAVHNYGKAVKLDKRNAVFHSNLGTAYFESKDYESARKQFAIAFQLDPLLYRREDGGGIQARVFSSADHGRFCFELARLAALRNDDAGVLSWLTKAGESGFDLHFALSGDRAFELYNKDPRVQIIIQNARALHSARNVAAGPIPPLPAPESR